ncbi:hypothetical protein SAMD00019534_116710 [Acytostelium subglobosum LB1]|uniref:hypothetical protein n=1 Tax=Acytostelium subglobosum LB1 TaxID=1410327 RepID=UPI0006451A4E|nr:hypothetical protein SAMD00019534_116710 [Acytostelium subglobosum LB1]GAM28495.1 hypothetical protein SAMD00019534_116710 [Acytostelium subglobosum LB1]|eukprot:XP_012748534.1 hypothetical protein SAMD00019534_116710 [Acytostelium subglobosum LB1]
MYDLTKYAAYIDLAIQGLFIQSVDESIINNMFQSYTTEIKQFFTIKSNVHEIRIVHNFNFMINCIVQSFVPDHLVPAMIGRSSIQFAYNKVTFMSTCKDKSRASVKFIDLMLERYCGMQMNNDKSFQEDTLYFLVINVLGFGLCGPAFHLLRSLYCLRINHEDVYKLAKLRLRPITHNKDNDDDCSKHRQLFKEYKENLLINRTYIKITALVLPKLPPLVLNHIVSMAIRFGFKKDTRLSQRWLVSLALVNCRFLKSCMVTLSTFPIPSLIIHDNIRVSSKYCLFKMPPLHLRSDEIKCVPHRKRPLCAERLVSLTIPFSITDYLLVKGSLPNLKTINFEEVEFVPNPRKWIDKREDIGVEFIMLDSSLTYPVIFDRLLSAHIKNRHGLQSINITTNSIDNPFSDIKDIHPQQQYSTINLKCHVNRLEQYQPSTSPTMFDTLSHISSIKIRYIDIPLLHMMTNLSSLHLQFNQTAQDNGIVDKLQQFYAVSHTLNNLELRLASENVIHLLPHYHTAPIKSLTLALNDIDQLAVLSAKGKLDDLFGTIATHLQNTVIKQLEYLTIYMIKETNIGDSIIPFNIQCLSALTTALQLHCIDDHHPINLYRLVE